MVERSRKTATLVARQIFMVEMSSPTVITSKGSTITAREMRKLSANTLKYNCEVIATIAAMAIMMYIFGVSLRSLRIQKIPLYNELYIKRIS